jgi:serine protease Do/serine protease DegQ
MKKWISPVAILLSFLFVFNSYAALPLADSQGNNMPTLAPMLEMTTPAVVNIATRGKVSRDQGIPTFPGMPQENSQVQSLGSGVIVDADKGYIITNHHVVQHADTIQVTLKDGRTLEARLVGSDSETDIAVVQVQADNLMAIPIGNSDKLRVGDFVVAIGNPFGLGQTVTSGIVSALGRSGLGIEGYEDFIQTDASINPGNSGGALVNLRGELVGINTAIFSQSGGNVGIGFAIPTNMAMQVMGQLIKYGKVDRGMLGVQVQDLTPALAKALGVSHNGGGAVVTAVTPNSPAEKSGLRADDIIVEVNGKRIQDSADVRNIVGLLRVGDQVRLTVIRAGQRTNIIATVGAPLVMKVSGEDMNRRLAGAVFANIEPSMPMYGKVEGVVIIKVEQGSPAWNVGLRPGDVITSANRRKVTNIDELQAAIPSKGSVLLNIRRPNGAFYVIIE